MQVYLNRVPNARHRLLVPCMLDPPNPKCYVCSPKPEVTVVLNCSRFKVGALQDKVCVCRETGGGGGGGRQETWFYFLDGTVEKFRALILMFLDVDSMIKIDLRDKLWDWANGGGITG